MLALVKLVFQYLLFNLTWGCRQAVLEQARLLVIRLLCLDVVIKLQLNSFSDSFRSVFRQISWARPATGLRLPTWTVATGFRFLGRTFWAGAHFIGSIHAVQVVFDRSMIILTHCFFTNLPVFVSCVFLTFFSVCRGWWGSDFLFRFNCGCFRPSLAFDALLVV